MDGERRTTYLAPGMDRTLRLFLTMLALLTGLAAAPAPARMAAPDTSEIERIEGGRSKVSAIVAATETQSPTANRDRGERKPIRPRPATVLVLIPSIQLVDRLLE